MLRQSQREFAPGPLAAAACRSAVGRRRHQPPELGGHRAERAERAGGRRLRRHGRRPVPLRPGRASLHAAASDAARHRLPGFRRQRAAGPRLRGRPRAHEDGAGRAAEAFAFTAAGAMAQNVYSRLRRAGPAAIRAGSTIARWPPRWAWAHQQLLLAQTVFAGGAGSDVMRQPPLANTRCTMTRCYSTRCRYSPRRGSSAGRHAARPAAQHQHVGSSALKCFAPNHGPPWRASARPRAGRSSRRLPSACRFTCAAPSAPSAQRSL